MTVRDETKEVQALDAAIDQMKTSEPERLLHQLTSELSLGRGQVQRTIELLDEGNTIPFIARYRKEMTGELDETQLRTLEERLGYLRGLEERKREVLRLINEQGKLTEPLLESIVHAAKLQEVEDLYRPYRQKRKTRASVAKERGLEPLAQWILSMPRQGDPLQEASAYVNEEKGVKAAEDALQGAQDIIAEMLGDDPDIRAWVRRYTMDQGVIRTEAKDKEQESVYEMYYEYSEPVKRLPSHRILAINRGEREDILKVALDVPVDKIVAYMSKRTIRGVSVVNDLLQATIEDAYKRLIAPSIEREVRGELTEKAEEQAIQVFAQNLRSLLLQPPVRGQTVLGVDPAFRTGCKLAVVDDTGKLLEVAVTYPTAPHHKTAEAVKTFNRLADSYRVGLVVIGNGTASRETEQFVADWIQSRPDLKLHYAIVSEAGASVYSASKLAAEEFPSLDVAERSAVSIARRLQDPLAELVKIDPKAIGVGQYQHDVAQKRLEESLGAVVESAVNHVGVDVNTASPSLLSYVSGINATLAKNIVKHREENGKFTERKQLSKVARLGPKAFQQCVGFLRIPDGAHPLDNTPIHPESYPVVDRLFAELGVRPDKIGTPDLAESLRKVDVNGYAERLEVGVPTLKDIIGSLLRPGRDPREELPPVVFRTDVLQIEDLKPGMELKGTVRNVIDFGAFVDIGIKNDGLVHISQLSDRYVKHPLDVVSVGDNVTVWVLSVDVKKGRVGLTMKRSSVDNMQ
ncbi:RNA-binding transcriptional accessory protein [Paenibacillus thiaminolyticus]|uniref:RNA-binding transcriptional accessory protein n=1 Tax=Paenibacillus thiaminolyticus TaxID=49283 RepID=A0AAP9DXH0_PANTH|nr:Tex family protein [Paenibacillus thiaminolyticus]MCY9533651.1 RNA-binding transcriptional accessory protein [Paenibacillus thiaminolyticus]MCY9600873.1 RNA-binding transcriptional accessory protein [Paenibacillus thiaminolyticus]MCY9607702.1 RNA-binding transcriptional accessory protein [Paenibacillus thiaminolyticus]MCY9611501.1 RNA-binding transcriptional accessory protein [Paenibacillus thiaminolyticus]MCY9617228.1 RNA-binding transcriptional accessory protein [Paenibacillus thiaminolyt